MKKTTISRRVSFGEAVKFLLGETLSNETQWHTDKSKNSSEGFCFFPEDIIVEDEDAGETYMYDTFSCEEFIGGVVNDEFCLLLEVDEELLTKSSAIYAHPSHAGTVRVHELCAKSYSMKDFKYIGICARSGGKYFGTCSGFATKDELVFKKLAAKDLALESLCATYNEIEYDLEGMEQSAASKLLLKKAGIRINMDWYEANYTPDETDPDGEPWFLIEDLFTLASKHPEAFIPLVVA